MAAADKFRADFTPPVTIDDDGIIVIARVSDANTVAFPLFQANEMPFYEVRKHGNQPLVPSDIVGSVAGSIFHDVMLTFHNAPGTNDPHWELMNPANLLTSVDLANISAAIAADITQDAAAMEALRLAILNAPRTIQYVDNLLANCIGNVPNGTNGSVTPVAGDSWVAWGASPRANPSGFDFAGGVTTRDDPITSVQQFFGAYSLTSNTVGGDVYTRTVQNCTIQPLNCYTNCNCNCNCACNCTCLCF